MKNITLIIALLTLTVGFGQELISNGDFEALATGGLTNSTTVGIWTSTSSSAVQDNSANSYEGTKYVNMGNDFRNLRQFFTATANTDYAVSFRYRNNFDNVATTDAPYVSIRINDGLFNGNGTIIESNQIDPFYDANLKVYNEYTFTFNSGANTDLVFYIFKDARQVNTNPNNAVRIDAVSISPTLSTNDLARYQFKSFPNPVKNVLNVSASKTIDKIEVYNLLGQQVLSHMLKDDRAQIGVSDLSNGVYLVKAFIEDAVGTYKFIKQ